MRIRDFSPSDLEGVLAVQRESPGAAQWSESDYRGLAEDPGGFVLVADVSDPVTPAVENARSGTRPTGPQTTESIAPPEVVGFAAFHRVLDEAEIRNMAVSSRYRRRGLANALLDEVHRRLSELGVKRVYLEVRAGNAPAIRLYETAGYCRESLRKDYYQGPDDDACVMSIALPELFLPQPASGRPTK